MIRADAIEILGRDFHNSNIIDQEGAERRENLFVKQYIAIKNTVLHVLAYIWVILNAAIDVAISEQNKAIKLTSKTTHTHFSSGHSIIKAAEWITRANIGFNGSGCLLVFPTDPNKMVSDLSSCLAHVPKSREYFISTAAVSNKLIKLRKFWSRPVQYMMEK